MRFRFGECVLDGETRELSRRGRPAHVSPKAFEVLELLLKERPRAVSKEEIMQRLWPGTYVTEGSLTNLIAELRAAIGDDAHESHFLRTLHRFGYAFSGDAEEEERPAARSRSAAPSAWRLFWDIREIGLLEGDNIVGRDPDATILVDHVSVSRHHAKIHVAGQTATLEDLDSKNGTFRRGKRIRKPVQLADQDEIRFGSVPMMCRLFSQPATTETTPEK